MKRLPSRIAGPLFGWLLAAPAVLAAGVDFEARLWAPELGGRAQVGAAGQATTIDLVSDLGFSDEEALEGRLIWRPSRRTSVRLDYATFDFVGNARLVRPVSFGGTTFQLDAQLTSGLELEYGGLGLAWQFLSSADGRLRIGPLVEARGLRGDASIRTRIAGILPLSAREDFAAGFAAAGLVLDLEPSRRVHLYAEWTTTVQSDEVDLTDAEVGLRFTAAGPLAVTVGYRRLEVDAASGNELFDFELDGPFFGGVLSF